MDFLPIIMVLAIPVLVIVGFMISSNTAIDMREASDKAMLKANLKIDKEIKISDFTKFLVDDSSKRFVYASHANVFVHDYNDLLDFEIIKDGHTVQSGKGLETVVGGITFGVAGALVGASGKRETTDVIDELSIKLHLNNLENSLLIINFPTSGTSYLTSPQILDEVVAALTYIMNNKTVE